MRHRIVLALLAFFPLCAHAQGSRTTSSSTDDLKVTLKAEPGYKKPKRVVRTWSVYPVRRVVYNGPQAKASNTNGQPLLVKVYVDPTTAKRTPTAVAKPVAVKAMVAKAPVVPAKAIYKTAKMAPMKAANRMPASVATTVATAPVAAAPVAKPAPVTPPVDTVVQVPPAPPVVLAEMTVTAPKKVTRQVATASPYQAGMASVTRASSLKKSNLVTKQQKIALNK